jgi:hypothetical protein
MPTVRVEGLGLVQFPDGTSEDDMSRSIQDALTTKNAPAPLSGPIGGASSVPEALQGAPSIQEGNREALQRGLPGLAKSILGTIGDAGALVNKLPLVGNALAPKDEVDYYQQHAKANNPDEEAGKVFGNIAQLAIPTGEATEALPSAERAAGVLGHVAEAAKNVHVPLNQAAGPLGRVTELGVRGGTSPKAASDLLTRSQAISPMTFPEARDYYSNISSLSGDEAGKLNGVMKKAVGALRSGFHGDLTDAAAQVGLGDEYANAMKEYANAMRLRDLGKTAVKALPSAGVLGGAGYVLDKLFRH